MLDTPLKIDRPDATPAGAVLLMVDESHINALAHRYAARPTVGPEERAAIARFGNAMATGGYGYAVDANGVAVVTISGLLTPEAWAWFDASETITDWVVRDLAAIAADGKVRSVQYVINSPGGYVAGAFELADAIAALSAVKPSAAFAAGYCCSAAFLLASQAGSITAYKTAIVGSIGTRSAVVDYHAYFERLGIKVIPIDSGGMKSAGLTGTEITAEQIEYFKSHVAKLQGFFTQAVATGRKVPLGTAQKWADGRVHVADDAKAMGLIDAVGTLNDAYTQLTKTTGGRSAGGALKAEDAGATTGEPSAAAGSEAEASLPKEADMSTTAQQQQTGATTPATAVTPPASAPATQEHNHKPASMAELKAACLGASAEFLVDASEKAMTLPQAKDAFIGFQAAQIRSRDTEIGALKAAAVASPTVEATKVEQPKKPGVPAISSAAAEAGNPVVTFAEGDHKGQAKAEWAANIDGCQSKFSSELAYCGYRGVELKGRVKARK